MVSIHPLFVLSWRRIRTIYRIPLSFRLPPMVSRNRLLQTAIHWPLILQVQDSLRLLLFVMQFAGSLGSLLLPSAAGQQQLWMIALIIPLTMIPLRTIPVTMTVLMVLLQRMTLQRMIPLRMTLLRANIDKVNTRADDTETE
ncbi:hypothetical protein BDV30DRAFT_206331 [Aspergillus minisclerotigenes]|uniref:Uncharacterized protein n=1 Tax=Aspergillus minisclerotigenes TaxID=656917 RepID=A0A5N6JFF0_9EURO|nr:hypothetical protein BDV30DRAFT_206331 [Aspergillus minisclerotigenes]